MRDKPAFAALIQGRAVAFCYAERAANWFQRDQRKQAASHNATDAAWTGISTWDNTA